jgi:hypothetical protein
VGVDDAADDRQAEAGPRRTGGNERIPEACADRLRDPGPRVAHLEDRFIAIGPGRHCHGASGSGGTRAVIHEVEQYLPDLVDVDRSRRRLERQREHGTMTRAHSLEHCLRFSHERRDVVAYPLGGAGSRESEQVIDQAFEPHVFLAHDRRELGAARVRRTSLEQVERGAHHAERRADLVREAGGHRPHSRERLLTGECARGRPGEKDRDRQQNDENGSGGDECSPARGTHRCEHASARRDNRYVDSQPRYGCASRAPDHELVIGTDVASRRTAAEEWTVGAVDAQARHGCLGQTARDDSPPRREDREVPNRLAAVPHYRQLDGEPGQPGRVAECSGTPQRIESGQDRERRASEQRRIRCSDDPADGIESNREVSRTKIPYKLPKSGGEPLVDVVDGQILGHVERHPRPDRAKAFEHVALDVLGDIVRAILERARRLGDRARAATLPLDGEHHSGRHQTEAKQREEQPERRRTRGQQRISRWPFTCPVSILRAMRLRPASLASALFIALVGSNALHAQLPASPASSPERIKVGGYTGITLTRPADSTSVRIAEANAAVIVSGSLTPRVSYLGEFDAVSSSRENYAGRQDDRELEIARLYLELSGSDLFRLRVGRFLTPVGQWNEIHAEPLTWTAVRPLATYRSFAKYSTGAMLAGQGALGGHDAGYALWAAPSLQLTELDDEELEFRGAVGGRVAIEAMRGMWIGASGGLVRERRPESPFDDDLLEEQEPPEPPEDTVENSEDHEDSDDRDERHGRVLAGLDLTARLSGFELRAEATWLQRGLDRPEERTAFVQLAAPLGRGLFAIGRGELTRPLAGRTGKIGLIGLHWRAPKRFVFKFERQDAGAASRAVSNGWFLSVSKLF